MLSSYYLIFLKLKLLELVTKKAWRLMKEFRHLEFPRLQARCKSSLPSVVKYISATKHVNKTHLLVTTR
jgi:hypothetical protein